MVLASARHKSSLFFLSLSSTRTTDQAWVRPAHTRTVKRVLFSSNGNYIQCKRAEEKKRNKHSPPEGHYLFRPIGYEKLDFYTSWLLVGLFGLCIFFFVFFIFTLFGGAKKKSPDWNRRSIYSNLGSRARRRGKFRRWILNFARGTHGRRSCVDALLVWIDFLFSPCRLPNSFVTFLTARRPIQMRLF